MAIDYARMQRTHRTHKSRLTRALNKLDASERQAAVVTACMQAVREWDAIGAWPDDWHRWNRALSDVGLRTTLDDLS